MKNFIVFIFSFLVISCGVERKSNHKEQLVNWKIKSSNAVSYKVADVSLNNFDDSDWYPVQLPSTVLAGLVDNKVYADIYFADNLKKIPSKDFENAWFYRTQFKIDDLTADEYYRLVFEGVNYSANIWLNGHQIADSTQVKTAFKIFEFNVSQYLIKGKNTLAVEVFPPEKQDLSIGFVDWNPSSPDKNMGLWRGVKLIKTKEISIKNVFVRSKVNLEALKEANLTIEANLSNNSDNEIETSLDFTINDTLHFSKTYLLRPQEEIKITVSEKDFPQLHLTNPKLWWTNNLGDQNLYKLSLTTKINNKTSDIKSIRFGIRDISEYITQEGYRGYKLNGKKILIKGAGWVDDMLLADTPEKVENQLNYVKHMNLNTIRLEGFWGNDKTLYDKADELGILIMIGWSCHWEWEDYCNRKEPDNYMCINEPVDMQLHAEGYRDQIIWLRNHPSVFLWAYGSDKLPVPELEEKLNSYREQYDGTRPFLSSCKYKDFDLKYNDKGEVVKGYINNSSISGPTRVKMRGPYAYITPNYWYTDTNAGGAFGFNTETGPGPQIPPLESMQKMLPKDQLWPINDMWNFHNGRHEFQTLDRYLNAFNSRYGACDNIADFTFKSQISNYEAMRAMYEAFEVNKDKATGVIDWMLNSAWPETFWQLYDWYLMPNAAFYATKTACQPLGLIYNYKDKAIYLNNEYHKGFKNLKATIQVLDINSKVLLEKDIKVTSKELAAKKIFDIPKLKFSTTYFVSLKLKNEKEEEISSNFYWLSTKEDVLDFKNSSWFMTPIIKYADFTSLNVMPKATIATTQNFEKKDDFYELTLNIENTSDKIAFFIDLRIKGSKSKSSILPIFWDDNYISLLPGEQREIKAHFRLDEKEEGSPIFSYKGFNL